MSSNRSVRLRILPVVLLTFLVLAASAQARVAIPAAHVEVATTACNVVSGNSVTFSWSQFANPAGPGNGGRNTPDWKIVYTPRVGSPTTLTGSVSFPLNSYSLTVAIPNAVGFVVASSTWTSSQTTDGSAGSGSNFFHVPNCYATPTIVTTASRTVTAGAGISDSAALSGGRSPVGTITFRLYSATDSTCSTPLSTSTVAVNGNGTYSSTPVTENNAGTYQWTASYSGDANNVPVAAEGCGVPAEQVVVTKITPAITTTASPSVAVGGVISDSAVLSGGGSPTGTITFSLYSATDSTCSTPLSTSTVAVNGNGTYGSAPVTEGTAGTYQWTASYSGDANNAAIAAEGCGVPIEQVTVSPNPTPFVVTTPTIATTASAGTVVGGMISDTAVLSGGNAPTGTIAFSLYPVTDTTCSGTPLLTGIAAVNGNGSYPAPTVAEPNAGTYQWTASYSGDGNNAAIAAEGCGVKAEQVVVTQIVPTITTTASPHGGCTFTIPNPKPCKNISDTATLSGGSAPTGEITFKLYAVKSPGCSTPPLKTIVVKVNGNGNYTTTPVVAESTAEPYEWTASYSGDTNNTAVAEPCGKAAEQIPAQIRKAACVVSSPVSLRGVPFGTTLVSSFTARVTALGVKQVTFLLDGRKLATLTRPTRGSFSITISKPNLSYGLHTVVAKVILKAPNCKPLSRKASFVHGMNLS